MNINIIDKDTVSVDGSFFKRVDVEEILICTLDGYQYFPGPEYDGVLDWADAKKWCKSLGEGYSLPNRLVMLAICMNEDTAALLADSQYYWTASELENDTPYAWVQSMLARTPGSQYASSKSCVNMVRAVRRRRIDGEGE